jgi:two-component system CheB/CheR fusion protein
MQDRLDDLLAFLKRQRGFDFTAYKPASLTRRIRHRMHMISSGQGDEPHLAAGPSPQITSYRDYMSYLLAYPAEFNKLFNAILINVTGFFRDLKSWEYLRQEVIPRIVAGLGAERGHDNTIRVWSAACAKGEEAYTLAMVFAETMGVDAFLSRVRIYASDINEGDLAKARAGIYNEYELDGIPEDFFGKYFRPVSGDRDEQHRSEPPTGEPHTRANGKRTQDTDPRGLPEPDPDSDEDDLPHFEVPSGPHAFDPELRRRIVFGRHDLLSDPPIPKVDLLTCRNALMYFNSEAQSRVLSRLHFSLVPGGYLFLGRAEMLLHTAHFFTPIDLKHRIFCKNRPPTSAHPPAFHAETKAWGAAPSLGGRGRGGVVLAPGAPSQRSGAPRAAAAAQSPPAPQLVIGRSGELILANESARRLFGISADDLARPVSELPDAVPNELRSKIDEVLESGKPVLAGEVLWSGPGHTGAFDVQLLPLKDRGTAPVAVSVTYTEVPRIAKLREDLQQATEDRETFHEELQAANEELQATLDALETTYQELQSTNEELEALNAELQSTNQDLRWANDQLRVRGEDAVRSDEFWNSVMASMQAAVVIVDRDMTVLLWNARSEDLWGLRSDEAVGRQLLTLKFGLAAADLREPVSACIRDGGASVTQVVNATNRLGRPIRCRISCSPLLGAAKVSLGAIILMEEESPQKAGER